MKRTTLLFSVLLPMFGCQGFVGELPSSPVDSATRMEPKTAPLASNPPVELRRLTRTELGRSLDAVFGFVPASLPELPAAGGTTFSHVPSASGQSVTAETIRVLSKVWDEVTEHVLANGLSRWATGCEGAPDRDSPPTDTSCVRGFAEAMSGFATRGSAATDVQAWVGLYEEADTHALGLRALIHRVLGGPSFLFVVEGEGVVDARLVELSSLEVATRLSLAFCHRRPSAELVEAAAGGELETEAGRAEWAEQLLTDCGAFTVENFVGQWLGLDVTGARMADPAMDPVLTADYIAGADAEWRALAGDVFARGDSLAELFGTRMTVADERVGAAYPELSLGPEPRRVERPETHRGIVSTPAFWLAHGAAETNPLVRGPHLLSQLLCFEVPDPPEGNIPERSEAPTRREVWEVQTEQGYCFSCHQRSNGLGFAAEQFDAFGRFRTEYEEWAGSDPRILAHASIPDAGLENLQGWSGVALGISDSPALRSCAARKWFEYALGRVHRQDDADAIATLSENFGRLSLRDALLSVVELHAFAQRQTLGDGDLTEEGEGR